MVTISGSTGRPITFRESSDRIYTSYGFASGTRRTSADRFTQEYNAELKETKTNWREVLKNG